MELAADLEQVQVIWSHSGVTVAPQRILGNVVQSYMVIITKSF